MKSLIRYILEKSKSDERTKFIKFIKNIGKDLNISTDITDYDDKYPDSFSGYIKKDNLIIRISNHPSNKNNYEKRDININKKNIIEINFFDATTKDDNIDDDNNITTYIFNKDEINVEVLKKIKTAIEKVINKNGDNLSFLENDSLNKILKDKVISKYVTDENGNKIKVKTHIGPRDGEYYLNKNKNKTYIKTKKRTN